MSQAKPDGSSLTEIIQGTPLRSGDYPFDRNELIRSDPVMLQLTTRKQRVNELVTKTRLWLEQAQTEQQQGACSTCWECTGAVATTIKKTRSLKKPQCLCNMQMAAGRNLATLKSDAYAAGQILHALYVSGMIKTDDAVYQKGLDYLLKTQNEKGAWFVAKQGHF